jgi:hypothetical protein
MENARRLRLTLGIAAVRVFVAVSAWLLLLIKERNFS